MRVCDVLLGEASCDVYLASLSALRPNHYEVLDATEAARQKCFVKRDDRDRFVVGAVLLRAVTARELQEHPAELMVDRTCTRCREPHGRPRLPGSSLEVSVSHSGQFVAVAVTRAGRIGIDIELMKALDYVPLVAEVCTEDEQTFAVGTAEFYTYWTRKEAFLKATGEGMRRPMHHVAVTPPGAPPAVVNVGGEAPPPSRMFDLQLVAGYAGALVVLTRQPLSYRTRDASGLLAAVGDPPRRAPSS